MKKNQISVLLVCTFFAVASIGLLYILSPINNKLQPGGFKRTYLRGLVKRSSMSLKLNSFYIAGMADSTIYLGNTTAIDYLVSTHVSLQDSQHIQIKMILDSVRKPDNFKVIIDSPHFFMTNGMEPVVLQGNIGEWVATPSLHDSASYFVEAVPISASSFALRSYSTKDKGYELGKINADSLYFNNNLLNKQIDGLFCLDGKLHYQKDMNRLVYLHFYRNEFMVADTMLQLKYRGHTIDTFTQAKIQVAALEDSTHNTMSRPPLPVNALSCLDGNNFYVQSVIMADNDDPEKFITNATIDVYDILTGLYAGSFHIPKFDNQTMKSFQVDGEIIFAIFGNNIVRYNFIK